MSLTLKLSLMLFGLFGLTVDAFAQSPGTFVATENMTVARSGHTATLLPDGRVLIAGGFGRSSASEYLASAELYDPATGHFAAIGNMNSSRAGHSATLLKDGTVLIAGGNRNLPGTAEIYDPSTGTFKATGNLNQPQWMHAATLLRSGKILIVGGCVQWAYGAPAELYDPDTGTFATLGWSGGSGSKAQLLDDGRVLIAGGLNQFAGTLYDPSSSAFTQTGALSTFPSGGNYGFGVAWHTANLLANGKVVVTGGGEDLYWDIIMPHAELYDPLTDTFTATAFMRYPRAAHTGTTLPGGRILMAGGCCTPAASRSAEIYDFLTERFVATGNMTTFRNLHTSTLLTDGTVLIAGGGYAAENGTDLGRGATASAELYFQDLSVSSATLSAPLAPGSLASLFGSRLAERPTAPDSQSPPTSLGGISLRVRDSAGVERQARLLHVSPTQIDFEVPAGTALGDAALEVRNPSNSVRTISVPIRNLASGK